MTVGGSGLLMSDTMSILVWLYPEAASETYVILSKIDVNASSPSH